MSGPIPSVGLAALLFVAAPLVALEGPSDLVAVAQEQHRWMKSISGLHVRYFSQVETSCDLSEAMNPPPRLFWHVDSETWYDRNLAGYRHEVRMDTEAFAKDVREVAKRESRLTPKMFFRFNVDSILVVTGDRSSYLERDSGRLLLRRAVAGAEANGLETGGNLQPLLHSLWLHSLGPDASYFSAEAVNPFVAMPTLAGVKYKVVKAGSPGPLQWQIEAELTQGETRYGVTLRLGRLGPDSGPQFWFLTGLESSNGFKAVYRWREIPGAPFVAVLESVTEQGATSPKVEVHKLVSAELIADPAPSLWTIDPLLATQIIDVTAGMEVDAAP